MHIHGNALCTKNWQSNFSLQFWIKQALKWGNTTRCHTPRRIAERLKCCLKLVNTYNMMISKSLRCGSTDCWRLLLSWNYLTPKRIRTPGPQLLMSKDSKRHEQETKQIHTTRSLNCTGDSWNASSSTSIDENALIKNKNKSWGIRRNYKSTKRNQLDYSACTSGHKDFAASSIECTQASRMAAWID